MHRSGRTTDRFIAVRQQRTTFYLATLTSLLIGAVTINLIPTRHEVRLALNLSVGTVVVVLIVNLLIKVSIHAMISALAALTAPLFLPHPGLLYTLGALIWATTVWSRYYNRRHTITGLILGTVFGVGLALLFRLFS